MRLGSFLALALLPAAALAGCSDDVPRVAGSAGPIVATSAPTSPAATSAPTSAATSAPASAPASPAKSPAASGPVLGHNGFGALKLGMTHQQATATGLIAPWVVFPGAGTGCSRSSHLLGGKGGDLAQGNVYYSAETGVEIIDAYPGVRTPEGIRIGSTSAAMLRAYPDWTNAERAEKHADGRGYADVPGNAKAMYRIMTRNGKVTEITLQDKHQNCYE